ncbi:CHAP domain-containing protein [Pseudomonas borbori]
MNKRRLAILAVCTLVPLMAFALHAFATRINLNDHYAVGEPLDELHGVAIYYNGGVNTVQGRNLTPDGYNLGLRYQCVEFIKRYYFERYGHRMPDSYGHAKDFFDPTLGDGAMNAKRAMWQFVNGGASQPQADDLLVFGPSLFNRYGHVAIVAQVGGAAIEIAQQNPGPFGQSRERLGLSQRDGHWHVDNSKVLGWLRLPSAAALEKAAPLPAAE